MPTDYEDWYIKFSHGNVRVFRDNLYNRVLSADDSNWNDGTFYEGWLVIETTTPAATAWKFWYKEINVWGKFGKDIDPDLDEGLKAVFGDGNEADWSQSQRVTHIYNAEADQSSTAYDYYVECKNHAGIEAYRKPTQTLTVNNINPVAYLIVQATVIKNVQMTAYGHLSYDQEGDIATNGYEFDFGEGGGWEATSNPYKTHTYTTTGVKTVKLRVKDQAGNYSSEDSQQLTVYDTGSVGTELTLMCPLHNIKEIPKGTISTLPYPELDYDGIQAMGSGNLNLQLTGEHHDPDESKTPAQRETSMKTERDAWKDADEKGTLVRYTFPQYGTLAGYLKGYQAELDERDYYRLPFTVTFIVVTEEQIQEP